MRSDLCTPSKAAEYLGVPAGTLAWWRCRGEGPAFLKVGRRVLYRLDVLDEYLASCERTPDTAHD